jgi:UDP-N-acetylmuramate--alanine ligase
LDAGLPFALISIQADAMRHKVKHIHFVGIGGVGMSGIAEVLLNLEYRVSGSDLSESPVTRHLQRLGARISKGHSEDNIAGANAVVISSAVLRTTPRYRRLAQRRFPSCRGH